MKRNTHIRISAGGVLLLAALYFLLDTDELAALLLAAAAHELGHVAAIRLTGGSVIGLTANATGAVIELGEHPGRAEELICAAAGPLAGLVWAALAAGAAEKLRLDMLTLSSGMSLVLSAYNSLPALPLDGGRVLECIAGRRAAGLCSLVAASFVLLMGVILAASGYGLALLIAGAALMLQQAHL